MPGSPRPAEPKDFPGPELRSVDKAAPTPEFTALRDRVEEISPVLSVEGGTIGGF